jgi:hypothetical protein
MDAEANGKIPDFCPGRRTHQPRPLGDVIKIGRRGSI